MLALGVLLTGCAILGIALLALLFRRPDPPRWTTSSWSDEAVAITLVCVAALGLGYLCAGSINAYQQGLGVTDLGLLAAAIVLAVVAWRQLGIRHRWRAMASEQRSVVARVARREMTASAAVGQAPPLTTEPPPPGPADRAA
jgi:hypothetical protein